MNKNQQGAVVLLVTSVLLVSALMLTFGSYRSVFYQIKRAQNEVEARKQHWEAEGGLECGFTQFKNEGSLPPIISVCSMKNQITPVFNVIPTGYQISSVSGHSHLKKNIVFGGSLSSGAMQSSADVYFYSSATFSTPDPGALSSDGWECVALRYRNRFYSSSVDNKGVIHGVPPYSSFNNPSGADCSNVVGNDHLSNGTGDDFYHDPNVKPFESFFGVPAADHNEIRDEGSFFVINGGGAPKILSNCGQVLATQINAGNHHLWVEGGCEVTQDQYNNLVDATAATDGVTILIHDGLMSFMGKPSTGATSNKLKGVLFHFNVDYSPTPADWASFDANIYLNHVPSVIEESYRTIASYYQHGAFTVSGGQYFDTPNQAAVFFDSLDFRFNKDVIDNSRKEFMKIQWQKGSWNDL
ncbi:hypothetical protein [Vibrio sp. 99-70-13A1]|uniref:hypothetical protein n=1 Tax=Vibrio sp. 99-70-13A1 TaxID=2607601 RepID=UPI001493C676|nr:hypothetical protein [Vibrio sp. 99-70-13A1]NOH98044.1 hypothetical protein [Vibrio sp. 99-70-13A1]